MAKETMRQFKRRVTERTGVPYSQIPWGWSEEILGGQILCRRGNIYVVTSGYPDVDENGDETFSDFRRVRLT